VEVAVRPPLGLSVPDTVVTCFERTTLLMPDTVFGGDGAYQYAWAGGTFTPDPGYTAAWQDTTLVCLTVTDGCETPDVTRCVLVAVKQIPDLVLTADTTEGCDPFFVIFNVQDTTGGATVTWNFGDGTVVNGPPAPVGHTYMDPGVFDVKVTAHWPNGCDDDSTFSDMIIVAAVPDAQFTWSPNPASTLDPTVHFAEQAGPYAVMWSWDLAGLDTAMSPDPVFVFPNDVGGHYPVQLVVANYLGCTDTIVRTIEVMDEFLVFVPTAFTPDGDGVNEQLFVLGDDIDTQAFVLNIFNRWGQMVFSTEDRSIGWDGTFGGKPVPDDVYNWKLEARSLWTGISHKLSGHVSVLR
ncbi:MAG TPA: gliding motility-associated C-terminal domain-containing protein, partial [Flavobacteriales bacterium]|nr:gliding motility-associated C-terminal domain-containing protein [Flavobacteriales bacterium]